MRILYESFIWSRLILLLLLLLDLTFRWIVRIISTKSRHQCDSTIIFARPLLYFWRMRVCVCVCVCMRFVCLLSHQTIQNVYVDTRTNYTRFYNQFVRKIFRLNSLNHLLPDTHTQTALYSRFYGRFPFYTIFVEIYKHMTCFENSTCLIWNCFSAT